MKQKQYRKDEIKHLHATLAELYGLDMPTKKDKVVEKGPIIWINDAQCFFLHEEKPLPTLKFLLTNLCLKKIVVDMGAVRFMVKGADCMRPGITNIDSEITKNEFVVVVDETHGKPLAVMQALFDGPEIESMDGGKVLKNIHYVGDEIWHSH